MDTKSSHVAKVRKKNELLNFREATGSGENRQMRRRALIIIPACRFAVMSVRPTVGALITGPWGSCVFPE